MKKKSKRRQTCKLNIDVLETRSIVLVDEFGKQRARLSCDGGDGGVGGFTHIQINDDRGQPRIELQVDTAGNASIRLATSNDGSGVSMAVNEGSGNGLSIGDHEGKPQITLAIPHPDSGDPRGAQPDITVIDNQSRRGWSALNGTYAVPTQEELDKGIQQAGLPGPA